METGVNGVLGLLVQLLAGRVPKPADDFVMILNLRERGGIALKMEVSVLKLDPVPIYPHAERQRVGPNGPISGLVR